MRSERSAGGRERERESKLTALSSLLSISILVTPPPDLYVNVYALLCREEEDDEEDEGSLMAALCCTCSFNLT